MIWLATARSPQRARSWTVIYILTTSTAVVVSSHLEQGERSLSPRPGIWVQDSGEPETCRLQTEFRSHRGVERSATTVEVPASHRLAAREANGPSRARTASTSAAQGTAP